LEALAHRSGATVAGEGVSDGEALPFEIEVTRKDGSRVPVLVGSACIGGESRMHVGFVLDLSERRRTQRRLAAQYAVARALADARTFREAAAQILRAVGESLGWQCGAVWRMQGNALRCQEYWSMAGFQDAQFERLTREGVRQPG